MVSARLPADAGLSQFASARPASAAGRRARGAGRARAALPAANCPNPKWYRRASQLMQAYPNSRPLGRPQQQAAVPATTDAGTSPPPATEGLDATPQATTP